MLSFRAARYPCYEKYDNGLYPLRPGDMAVRVWREKHCDLLLPAPYIFIRRLRGVSVRRGGSVKLSSTRVYPDAEDVFWIPPRLQPAYFSDTIFAVAVERTREVVIAIACIR